MLGLLALLACQAEPADTPHTVVWVVAASLRADALDAPELPHLDAFREDAMDLQRTHAASSWPMPSVATLVTARPPWEHRVVRDVLTKGRHGHVSPFHQTVFERFGRQGHRTAGWTSGPDLDPRFQLLRGADHIHHADRAPAHIWPSSAGIVDEVLDWLGEDDGPAFAFVYLPELEFNFEPDGACRGRYTAELPAPFVLPVPEDVWRRWNARNTPHVDAEVAYTRALYREDLCALDGHVGALVDGLKALDRWDGAQVLITSDHGDELWDYSTYGHGQGIQSVLTQVPFLLHDPAIEAGRSATLLGHAELISALLDRRGPTWDLVASGQTVSGRKAFSSSPSRTLDTLSWIDEDLRAELRVESRTMMVWDVDERGWETGVARTYNTEWQTLAAPELTPLLEVHPGALDPVLPQRPWIVDR